MSFIRSVVFIIVFYGLSTPAVILSVPFALVSRRAVWAVARWWSGFHYLCARLILGIRVKVEGELVDGPSVYVCKHESMFETIDLLRHFHHPVIVAKQELLRIPLWGYLARRHGMISINRKGGAVAVRQILRAAHDAVDQGRPIIIFPEGSRAHRGEWRKLQSGFAGLYNLLGLPLVPVAVDSGRCAPRDHFVWNSGTITYQVQEAIPPGLDRREVRKRVHAAINALNDPRSVGLASEIGGGGVLPLGDDAAPDRPGAREQVE